MVFNSWSRIRPLAVFAAVVPLINMAGLLLVGDEPSGFRAIKDIWPEVDCSEAHCAIRIVALVDGHTLRSATLPFFASTGEVFEIPIEQNSCLRSGKNEFSTAWTVGSEEQSMVLAIELFPIDALSQGLIVYQAAGFEHGKCAYAVFEIEEDRLKTHLTVVEGVGPERIELWPEEEEIVLRRSFGSETVENIERYRWEFSESTKLLILVE